ncbi:MAG: Uncharacterised protein [Chloroflexota bacterium]|nr:MAG: Uncharacterised protein [Chloroflexota bacterium]
MRSKNLLIIDARSLAVFDRQPGKAFSAASMARRVSAVPHLAVSAITSPVAGFVTGVLSPESASIHSPSINARPSKRDVSCNNIINSNFIFDLIGLTDT